MLFKKIGEKSFLFQRLKRNRVNVQKSVISLVLFVNKKLSVNNDRE
jgi:hypothetical protein